MDILDGPEFEELMLEFAVAYAYVNPADPLLKITMARLHDVKEYLRLNCIVPASQDVQGEDESVPFERSP